MKKLAALFILAMGFAFTAIAQQAPLGMKYQAVARNLKGEILVNEPVTLMISLFSRQEGKQLVHYMEQHTLTTNELGLFTLVIGEGKNTGKDMSAVPWSTEEIWMEISIMEKGSRHFTTVSSSKLMAVPYAFHSMTASRLETGISLNGREPGVPANVWSLQGNSNSNPLVDKLGTTDNKDLIFVTNNLERLKITAAGDINIANSLRVGIDVEVGNDLYVKKNVFLNTVDGSTTNNGAFTVANDKPTSLTGTLTVGKDSWLKGKLRVDGVTDLNDDLNVNNESPSVLTGTLRVDKAATFKQQVLIDNASLTSNSTTTGGLVVAGGAGIGQNLNIGSNLNVGSDALIQGRAGVGTIYGNVSLNVTAPNVVNHLPFFAEVAGTNNKFYMNNDGQLYLGSSKGGSSSNTGNYAMFVDGQDQGIIVRLKGKNFPNQDNHYMSFWGANNVARGRIEGQDLSDLHNSFDYIWNNAMGIADEAFVIAEGVATAAQLDAAEAVVMAVEGVVVYAKWAEFLISSEDNVGIAFESGSGDYAEWLEKSNASEQFSFGDIVSVKGGRISKHTQDGGQLMVISMSPIVLGNMPEKGREQAFEKVAFMGQVPVKVIGSVQVGDYILASGKNDGYGYAVSPSAMRLNQYKDIVGVAWSATEFDKGVSFVKVAVGINSNDLVGQMLRQQESMNSMQLQLNTVLAYLKAKDPSFDGGGITPVVTTAGTVASDVNPVISENFVQAGVKKDLSISKANYIEHLINDRPDLLAEGVLRIKEKFIQKGLDVNKYPELVRLFNDKDYLISKIREMAR